ncbi:translocation/assembly module TamB [Subsaximicrobium wynnwilliamsii]|uniref:Translocation/assembly module TamB n=1 Tax=Subsaximicrobium wynnwilliamsii TaxID=291179 RepID=A0A5C6ZH54_9FLAO|nr:translocation/assembly module TamB [Subsaximicrobium wynnwilliamsii]TXD89008.1 translocation/assembly module TamB [Subsaximicrobium wynnwilliamsii]TXE04009.1 translocation/assembly module TamB [Subsaximicrobium wynnwilliamsii]
MLFFSIPAVQTYLGKRATKRLNDAYGTNINIGKVGLQFNGDVELKNVFIEDYKQDTLINIDELNTSIISFKNLYYGKLVFGDIDIINLTFNVRTYLNEEDTNLDVFVQKFQSDNPDQNKSEFLLSSSDVSILNGKFNFINDNKANPKLFEFYDLNINATNFVISGSDVNARINTLAFKDSRGAYVKNLITNFEYSLNHMSFGDLSIRTEKSILKGNLRFDYDREDFANFADKVIVTANFKDSELFLNDLNAFYNEFGKNQTAYMDVDFSGTLNDLYAKNLKLRTSSRTQLYGDLNFKNLFNTEEGNFSLDGRYDNLSTNYYDLKALLPNILGEAIPSVFSKFGNFTIRGQSYITTSTIDADLNISTDLGRIISNMRMKQVNDIDNAYYVGDIVFEDFNLGKLLNNPKIGNTSFDLDVDGRGFTLDNLSSQIKGRVYQLEYNDYNYRRIDVSGKLGNRIFNGFVESFDENFKFKFDGLADLSEDINTLNFTANVDYANLRALNFISKDSISVFRGMVTSSIKGSNIDDAFGTLNFQNTTYINEHDEYYFKDFEIESQFSGSKRTITIDSPDIIEGSLSGDFKFKDIGKLVENSVGSIYTNYVPNIIETDQYLEFDFRIYNKIIEVFYSELELGANTRLKGRMETDEKQFNLSFNSPQIKLFDYFADDISILIDNSNPLFNTYIEMDSLSTKYYDVSKFSLINVTQRDTLFIRSEFSGGKQNADRFDLSLYYTIDESNKSVVGFRKSNVTFKENTWTINEDRNKFNKVAFDRDFKNFDISQLVMSHMGEQIELSGVLRDSTYKDLNLDFTDVDLAKITPRLDSLSLGGVVNGKLDLLQEDGVYLPKSNVIISDFRANDYELGTLRAMIIGNQSLTNYTVDVTLKNDNLKSLDAKGTLDFDNKDIDIDIDFDEFLLDPLDPFGQGVITNIRGLVTGNAKVSGKLDNPNYSGELLLDNAGLSIPYLNIDYSFDFDSKVILESQRFVFDEVEITDSEFFSRATLNGYISHNNFSDWRLGLEIDTKRLLVLNTDYDEEQLYYGTAFVNGSATIKGPTNQLVIAVDGSTAQGTVFKIPLNDLETYGDNTYIHFLSPEEKEARLRGEVIRNTEVKGLELQFDLIVNPYADIEIVIDRNSGSTIRGTGNGNLLFNINTNGKFQMFGDFQIVQGTYNFAYAGLVQKKLTVEPGGSIRWEGDPLKAQIGLKAIYKTQANPSVLLDNPINRSIDIEVEVNLVGQLEQPEPDFTFNFPNVSSTIKSELDYRLETKESRTNQALFLLSTGSFASEISLGQQAYGTISDRVNSFFNSFLTNEDGKLQVGVNYELGEQTTDYETDDRLGLTLTTKISDRVMINGKVGVPIGGVNQTVIAGDVQIDVLLNDDGTLTAKFFNRENSIQNFGERIGYTQGAGIAYNVEFDTFKELIQIILYGNRKDEIVSEAKKKAQDETEFTPDFINMKSEKDK